MSEELERISYNEAVALSLGMWELVAIGRSKQEVLEIQKEFVNKYGNPVNDCWMCSHSNNCDNCPLSSCGHGSLWWKWTCAIISHDFEMAKIYAADIRDVFKSEAKRIKKGGKA